MMGFGDDGSRDIFDELAFCLKRILAVGRETETFADTEYMCIDRHSGLIPDDRTNDVGGLATNSLQRLQVFDVIGYDAIVDRDQTLRHLNQVFGFRAWVADRLDVLKDLVGGSFREAFGRRVSGKEGRSDHIDALVRTLRGEHHSYQALEGTGKNQFTFCNGHVRLKPR